MVGAAEAFHEGEHHAEAGEDAEGGGGEDDLGGMDSSAEDVRLQQVHGVRGQKLIESCAEPAGEVGPFRHLSDERGENQGSGKEHEHAGIGRSLGGVDDVVRHGLGDGVTEIDEERFHALHWQE